VERKSITDLVSVLVTGELPYAIGELATLPRAAVVVEDRYSQIFKLDWVHFADVVDGLAELQIRWPAVPIVCTETRQLDEDWTYRYLAAAHADAETEQTTSPSTAQVRAWARSTGLTVPDRGRLHTYIWQAWRDAHP
jgi:ERCC4-type nuclease